MLNYATGERWRPAPDKVAIARDEVHVWKSWLNHPPDRVLSLRELLSADEKEKADRFYFQRDRDRYTVGRGMLRIILGLYLRSDPVALAFSYNSYGKPSLDGAEGRTGYRFNVSHSDVLAVYAVTRDREIGIDVEKVRADLADEQIADRFFSKSEADQLRRLPEEIRQAAFFSCWTKKEAYIKARGAGLSIGLDQFDVAFAPGEPPALLRANGDEPSRWSLMALSPEPGFMSAIAVEGSGWRLECWQCPR